MKLLRGWLEELGPHGKAAESALEVLLYRLLVDAKLPRPIRQHPVRVGRRERRIDLAYPEIRLAIEGAGYSVHRGKLKWQSDLDRANEIQGLGWNVVQVTWDRYSQDPQGIVELVRGFLGRAGLL